MDAQQELTRAMAHLRAGRKSQAQGILTQLVRQDPSFVDGWFWLAVCLEDHEKKVYCLNKVLALDPNHDRARRVLADLQRPAGDSADGSPQATAVSPVAGSVEQASAPAQPVAARRAPPTAATDQAPAVQRFAWYQVWLSVLILPTENTFRLMLDDPDARPKRGYGWVFVASLVGYFLSIVMISLRFESLIKQMGLSTLGLNEGQAVMGYTLIGMMCAAPIVAGLSVLGVIVAAAIYQFVAQFVDGKGTFEEMVYALAAVSSPLYLVSALIIILPMPVANVAGLVLSLYGMYLTLVALKAVNRFSWGSSCITVVAIPVLLILCSCLLGFLLTTSLMPPLEDILSTLTPMP